MGFSRRPFVPMAEAVIDATENRDWDWLTPGRFAAALAVLVALPHLDLLLGTHTLVARDFGMFSYPLAVYQRECFWHGEWPLWDPYSSCGVPFLAQWNTVACSPASLIFLLLPLPWSLNVFMLFFQFWAGLGMYFLAFRWTNHRLAAAVAGVGFAFSGFMGSWFGWSNLTPFCWMPWVVWLVEEAWRKGGRMWLWAAGAGALQMLGGSPDTTFMTWGMLGLLLLVELGREREQRARRGARFAGLVVVISALSAVQLLPFFQLLGQSERSASFATNDWSMPAWGWANLLVPLFRVKAATNGVMYQPEQYLFSSYYPGIGILALGLWALVRVRAPQVRLLGAILAVSLVLALGDHGGLYSWLRRLVPALGAMRYPVRTVLPALFALPLLAAFGLREWCEAEPDRRRGHERGGVVLGAVLLAGMGVIVAWAVARPLHSLDAAQTAVSAGSRAGFLVLALALAGVLARATEPRMRCLAAIGLPLLLWLDGLTQSPGQNPVADPAVLVGKGPAPEQMNPPPALGQGRAMLSYNAFERLYAKSVPNPTEDYLIRRLTLTDNCNLLDRLPKVDGFFSVHLAAERAVNRRLFGPDGLPLTPLADFLGVTQVLLSADKLEWTPRRTALPLVTAGQRPIFLDPTNTLEFLRADDFDAKRLVFLPLELRGVVTATNATTTRVVDVNFTAQRVGFTVEASEPSLVVIAQNHYPCWHARVDDSPVPLWRANHAFQALQVPAGRHQVRVVYEDRAFHVGLAVSLVTALGWLAAWVILKRRERGAMAVA